MADSVKLISICKMTLNDYWSLPGKLQKDDMLGFYSDNDEIILKDLELYNYTVIKVNINNNIYTVYHGFPKSEAAGAFKLNNSTWYRFGKNSTNLQIPNSIKGNRFPNRKLVNPVYRQFIYWYLDITDNESDFEVFSF